jgi:hypothetical protein
MPVEMAMWKMTSDGPLAIAPEKLGTDTSLFSTARSSDVARLQTAGDVHGDTARFGRTVNGSQRLRKQSERFGVAGLDGTEVAAVKGRHLGHVEPLRYCDEACVSAAEWPVVVELDELRHALVVRSSDVDGDQLAGREQPQERRFALAACSSLQQVADFCGNSGRYKQLFGCGAQQLGARLVVAIVNRARCHERAGVDQNQRPSSASRQPARSLLDSSRHPPASSLLRSPRSFATFLASPTMLDRQRTTLNRLSKSLGTQTKTW